MSSIRRRLPLASSTSGRTARRSLCAAAGVVMDRPWPFAAAEARAGPSRPRARGLRLVDSTNHLPSTRPCAAHRARLSRRRPPGADCHRPGRHRVCALHGLAESDPAGRPVARASLMRRRCVRAERRGPSTVVLGSYRAPWRGTSGTRQSRGAHVAIIGACRPSRLRASAAASPHGAWPPLTAGVAGARRRDQWRILMPPAALRASPRQCEAPWPPR